MPTAQGNIWGSAASRSPSSSCGVGTVQMLFSTRSGPDNVMVMKSATSDHPRLYPTPKDER